MRCKKNDGSELGPTPFENSLRSRCGEGDLGRWECIEAREVPWETSNIPPKLPSDSPASKFAPNTPSLHPSDYPSATYTIGTNTPILGPVTAVVAVLFQPLRIRH
jgi:hypothetical protein